MFENPNEPPIDLSGINYKWYSDIQYGSVNKEVMDIFIPTDAISPTGVIIYMHAGGFTPSWDKSRAYVVGGDIKDYLDNNIAYVTISYDLVETEVEKHGYINSMYSGKRAIQFLKLNSEFLNLDKDKFLIKGASAGAGIGMWIGYQPDLAISGSTSPILQQSTSIKAITLLRPQATYNTLKWESEIFATAIPEWDLFADYSNVPELAKSLHRTFGIKNYDEFLNSPSKLEEVDMLQFIEDYGGIPTFINSPDTLYTELVGTSIPDIAHSPYHGQIIKTYLENEGTEVVAYLNGLFVDPTSETESEFIKRMLSDSIPSPIILSNQISRGNRLIGFGFSSEGGWEGASWEGDVSFVPDFSTIEFQFSDIYAGNQSSLEFSDNIPFYLRIRNLKDGLISEWTEVSET